MDRNNNLPQQFEFYKYQRSNNYNSQMSISVFGDVNLNRRCSNCFTKNTSIWRKNALKTAYLCNACGIYERVHKKNRPFIYEDCEIRVKRKGEIHNNCLICDAVCDNQTNLKKFICIKCRRESGYIDFSQFDVFSVDSIDKRIFQKSNFGNFYRFDI